MTLQCCRELLILEFRCQTFLLFVFGGGVKKRVLYIAIDVYLGGLVSPVHLILLLLLMYMLNYGCTCIRYLY